MTKLLNNILYGVSLKAVAGNMDIEVSNLAFDSRKVEKGDVFIAVDGTLVDGHDYIDNSIDAGASVIVCSALPKTLVDDITFIEVANTAQALAIMAANFFGNPAAKLKLVGILFRNSRSF